MTTEYPTDVEVRLSLSKPSGLQDLSQGALFPFGAWGKGMRLELGLDANIRQEPGVVSNDLWRLMREKTQRKQSPEIGIAVMFEYESGSN